MTPRKFKSQLDVHEEVQRAMYSNKGGKKQRPVGTVPIDQVPGWN